MEIVYKVVSNRIIIIITIITHFIYNALFFQKNLRVLQKTTSGAENRPRSIFKTCNTGQEGGSQGAGISLLERKEESHRGKELKIGRYCLAGL